MTKRMLIDAIRPEETRVVIVGDHNRIEEFDFITSAKSQVKGNIYLAKITRVEPSLQAAFVEYGGDKQGFLSFTEIHPDYYQIPIADRKRLLEEQARIDREEAEREARREQEDERRRADREARGEGRTEDGEDGQDEDGEGNGNESGGFDEGGEGGHGGGGRRRGRGRMRRRTYAARSRDESVAPLSTSSEIIEGTEATEATDATITATLPTAEHIPSGEEGHNPDAPPQAAPLEGEILPPEGRANHAAPTTESDNEAAEKPAALDTASDEEDIEHYRKSSFSKRYRIQEVIKRGQIVLVQVIKEERGNKGVSLTTYISLAGRYCVLMPNASKDGGISRKVGKNDERKRLREIAAEMKESCGMSVIIRTAGLGRTKVEIKRDHEYLIKLWNMIREDALAATAPALIYEESDIMKRTIRDSYDADIEEVLVQGEEAFKTAKEFMKLIMPSHAARVKQYREDSPILSDYHVESQLEEMYQPQARLRSGGYVVINHTEALIAIDVNSGRSTSERNVEETALKTNLEAAREVARQLRLRDLGGLIVVDFIDMFYGKNRRAVERAFKDALRADRAKIQVGHISPFGLLELSRQRMRPSIGETTTLPCPHCQGTGHIRSNESIAIDIVRALEREASSGQFRELRVTVSNETALHMLNRTRGYINDIEAKFDVSVVIKTDHAYLTSQFTIEKIRKAASGDAKPEGERKPHPHAGKDRFEPRRNNRPERTAPTEETATGNDAEASDDQRDAEEVSKPEDGEKSGTGPRRRSRGGRGRNRRRGNRPFEAGEEGGDTEAANAESSDSSTSEPQPVATATFAPPSSEEAPAPAVAEETATPAKPRRGRPPSATRRAKPAAKDKDTAPVHADAPAVVATATIVQEDTTPKGPARKGWWSKVMS